MRFLYCAVIILCSLFLGIEAAERHKQCCKIISDFCGLCLHMQSCIRYEQTEPELIMQSYTADSTSLSECQEAILQGCTFHEAWAEVTASAGIKTLTEAEISAIKEMGERLGMCDCEGELARLKRINSQLESCLQKRTNEIEAKRRLCISCGLFAGIFISIIII